MLNRNAEAYCGLYCGACPVYLQRGDDWIVRHVLDTYGISIQTLHCEGCRSNVLSPSCKECPTRDCAQSKGLDSCSQCSDMPCDRLARFGSIRPHGAEVVGNLTFLRDKGSEAWLTAQAAHWQCATCGRAGSWYETACAQCGTPLPAGYEYASDQT